MSGASQSRKTRAGLGEEGAQRRCSVWKAGGALVSFFVAAVNAQAECHGVSGAGWETEAAYPAQDISSFAEDWGSVLAPLIEALQSPLSDLLALVRA